MDAFVYYCFQNGETWAIGSFTLTGKNPERPIYKTTNINTWPSKLKNWKYYNLNKRGGMWIPADKEFHIDEACKLRFILNDRPSVRYSNPCPPSESCYQRPLSQTWVAN